jgi:hypothetical protein
MNKSCAPRAANTNPSSMRAPILVALPSTREREVLSVAKGQQVFVDGVTAVIRVHPEYGDGNNPRARSSACTTPCRVRCRSGKHSVHVVAMSVNVNVYRNAPSVVPPQCATRSPSRNPGLTPLHSVKRAHRDLLLEQSPRLGRAQPARLTQRGQQPVHRRWTEGQQLCADLIGETTRWPWRSRVGMSSGRNGTIRLAQIALAADHPHSAPP